MRPTPEASRCLRPWMARVWLLPWLPLVSLLSGCQTIPTTAVAISPKSSLLVVEVLFPFPMSRDPSLVQVFFVRGPIHGGLEELPELLPASFVKSSRAYLLDPEPGTYSLVAVTSAVAPPWNEKPVAGGVTQTVWSGVDGHTVVFPAELIRPTRTTVTSGDVAFMGTVRVRRGDRVDADAVFHDDLQQRIAERIRPGVSSEAGVGSWFTMTWLADVDETSLNNDAGDRESFFDTALTDFGQSPWASFVARAAFREATAGISLPPAPGPQGTTSIPGPIAAKRRAAVPESDAMPSRLEPQAAPSRLEPGAAPSSSKSAAPIPDRVAAKPRSAARRPKAAPPKPQRRRFTNLPPGSPLAEIEFGMSHEEVRTILGDPDVKTSRLTAKAWIPFYTGPGAELVDWIYDGRGRVVFSLHDGSLEVLDVVDDPGERP